MRIGESDRGLPKSGHVRPRYDAGLRPDIVSPRQLQREEVRMILYERESDSTDNPIVMEGLSIENNFRMGRVAAHGFTFAARSTVC